jgi:[ribosomal protein S5]-alanine N-acetyltransferase
VSFQAEPAVLHETTRVFLRRLTAADRDEFVELVRISADFLYPWVKLPGTSPAFDEYLKRFDRRRAECTLICIRDIGRIAGVVTISEIVRGPYRKAIVGYNAFAHSAGQGYISEGFGLVFRFAFGDLNLHRLEADIQPANEASLRLARKVGFRREGYSPKFILIDDSWKDHERWAINRDMVGPL